MAAIGTYNGRRSRAPTSLFVKVDILVVHVGEVWIMVTNEITDQFIMGGVIGSFALWSWKYVKDYV
jgi:hypothetical protein